MRQDDERAGAAAQVVGVMSVGKGHPIVEARLSEIFITTQPTFSP